MTFSWTRGTKGLSVLSDNRFSKIHKTVMFAHVIQLLFMLENQVDTYKEDNEQDTYNDGEEDPLQRVDDEEGGPDEEDNEEYQEEEDNDYEPTIVGEQRQKLSVKDISLYLRIIDRSPENTCAGVSFLKKVFSAFWKILQAPELHCY